MDMDKRILEIMIWIMESKNLLNGEDCRLDQHSEM